MSPSFDPTGRPRRIMVQRERRTPRPSLEPVPQPYPRRNFKTHRPIVMGSNVSPLDRVRFAIDRFLKDETRAGLLLMGAAAVALLWANSPARDIFTAISNYEFGPASLGMHLTVHEWAADGVLTLFFFVVGLELKTEFVTGALRDIREAALPMLAAAFGMVGPALVYTVIQLLTGSDAFSGWAVPTATDIAFAVAVLGIFGKGMPPAARTFLLTLAVMDDLLAIIVIAIFYSSTIHFLYLGGAFLAIAIFGYLTHKRMLYWWILVPIAVIAWIMMLNSGVHATISGVALGLTVPAARVMGEEQITHSIVEKLGPWSAGLALPIFAFFAAGVNVIDGGGIIEVLSDPVALGIMLGLPIGKCLGIWGSVAALTRTTPLRLGNGVDLQDIFALSLLAGIGFTVALLVASLAFGAESAHTDHARLAVILGTLISVVLGGYAVHHRVRVHVRGAAANRR